jgi:hypothetical protein
LRVISCDEYPINEKTRIASGGAAREKSPEPSVVVPTVDPLIRTLTPGSGWPFSSKTFPFISCVWAIATPLYSRQRIVNVDSIFIGLNFWIINK